MKNNWKSFEQYLIESRYSIKDSENQPIEHSYQDVIKRVVDYLQCEQVLSQLPDNLTDSAVIDKISELLLSRRIIPATPVLMHFGAPSRRKTYFSCYPLGYVEDSIEDIMSTARRMAIIFRSGGGVGIDLSKLRSKGSLVSNGQGIASGPTAFLNVFDGVTQAISQGGRRRGALMVTLDARHPDLESFVKAKLNGDFKNMNISIIVNSLSMLNKDQWKMVAEAIHACGDPGVMFLDNVYQNTPIPAELEPRHSNPCAEYLNIANTACSLIHLNIPLLNNKKENYVLENIHDAAYHACLFQNILSFLDGYPDKQVEITSKLYRPIGVGMTGFHEFLIDRKIQYDSQQAIEWAEKIQATIVCGSMLASARMQKTLKTTAIPCRREWMLHFLDQLENCVKDLANSCESIRTVLNDYGSLYNITTTTQAPTGSISQLIHRFSTGIEPIFALKQKRKFVYQDQLKEVVLEYPTSSDFIPHTAHEISPDWHIKITSAIQKFCHTGVSKTINLAEDTTTSEIVDLIEYAHDNNLKAISFYRDKSKAIQILENAEKQPIETLPSKRPAEVYEISGPRTCYVIITYVNGQIRETFINTGKGGSALNAAGEALGRVLSVGLRAYPSLREAFANALKNIDSGDVYVLDKRRYKSLFDAIGHILSKSSEDIDQIIIANGDLCPSCGKMTLKREGGCKTCQLCGYSTC